MKDRNYRLGKKASLRKLCVSFPYFLLLLLLAFCLYSWLEAGLDFKAWTCWGSEKQNTRLVLLHSEKPLEPTSESSTSDLISPFPDVGRDFLHILSTWLDLPEGELPQSSHWKFIKQRRLKLICRRLKSVSVPRLTFLSHPSVIYFSPIENHL